MLLLTYLPNLFRDDIRLSKCLTRKGVKYVETVLNTSKQEKLTLLIFSV